MLMLITEIIANELHKMYISTISINEKRRVLKGKKCEKGQYLISYSTCNFTKVILLFQNLLQPTSISFF